MSSVPRALLIDELLEGYRRRQFTPVEVVEEVLRRAFAGSRRAAWIRRLSRERLLAYARALEGRSPDELPLYGVPFAIKDNIDLVGVPTTCACPDAAYVVRASAPIVHRLIDAGAIPIGKTNLDQFATGLVGTRSPYGACTNPFDAEFIAGGSSSGSAVAVSAGEVSFSLGTDTAGSGRVPAAFNNVIGLKPSCGVLSTRGVVPACRSLDCVSIFALCAADAARVYGVARGFDRDDPYSRVPPVRGRSPQPAGARFRFGVPKPDQLEFFGDAEYARCFQQACARAVGLGGEPVELDLGVLFEAGRLLYEGPWLAERYASVGKFLELPGAELHPVTREIIAAGASGSAVDTFRAQHRLQELRRETDSLWREVDWLMTPTAGTIYRIAEIDAQPIQLNANLGRYTTFVNLLDLAAVAVPSGFRGDGLPFGITLLGPAGSDLVLLEWADRFHRASALPLGALGAPPLSSELPELRLPAQGWIPVAVCGAHMEGLPLNPQLAERGGRLRSRTRTAAAYRLYALPGGPPHRPGLIRVAQGGAALELEVWDVPGEHFGSFVAGIPAPLGIGKVELEDGTSVCGFLCESTGLAGATDITELGGWRAYLARPS